MNDITVIVRAFADFRAILGAQTEVMLAPGRTIRDLLELLSKEHSSFREKVFDSDGRLSEGIDIIINGRNVGHTQNLTVELQDGDQVFFFRPLSGG
ncbi:MAG: MoaD family protein [Deltaproteobacteria bacterium]|nr:MoaD family protein [Deltaproteobacteria bacterium]